MKDQAKKELDQIANHRLKKLKILKAVNEYRNITVNDIGEHMRFMAESRSRGEKVQHLVDLIEHKCSCEDSSLRLCEECDHLSAGYYRVGKMFVSLLRKEVK